ncbi:MAG TPA: LysE family translocator [Casimicrobiaceae bacterium]|nr:LysE family translocator [Casimicrobiaceae bacterium]
MFANYPLFLVACVLLVLTPGPNLLYLISRTLCQGKGAGLISLAGTTSGFVVHIVAASLGLSAVLIAVPVMFDAVRFAGAAYLLWLAFDSVRSRGAGLFAPRELAPEPPAKLFRTGLLTSILNPKVALFYLALFPQFIVPAHGHVLVQSLALGATQIVIAVVGDALFVLAAARISRWLARRPLWMAVQRWVQGGVFAAIAVKLALTERS